MSLLHRKCKFLGWFDPQDKGKIHQYGLSVATVVILLMATVCLGLMSLYFSSRKYKDLLPYIMKQPLLVFLNILPFAAIALVLWALTNRAWVAFLADGALCLSYSWANYWKIMSRSDAVYAEELAVLREAMQMGGEGYVELTPNIFISALLVLFGTLVLFLFCRGRISHLGVRRPVAAVLIVACVLTYSKIYTSATLYNSFQIWPYINPYINANQYMSRGGIYPFLYSIQSATTTEPDGYNKNQTKQTLAQYETDTLSEDEKVSVIVVMYEAFADLSGDTDLITGVDPYAEYHALADESYHGNLFNNIFAGGTITTERAVLTGFANQFSYRRTAWSYARYFGEQGFALNGSHPGYEGFYSRSSINANLGIKDYYFFENHYNALAGGIARDEILLPEIARLCNAEMDAGNYVFSFNVTYQNHGPYTTTGLKNETVYVPQGELSDYDYSVINNYLDGVADTSHQMMEMVNSYRDSEHPVVLVFFGDHRPWLGDSSSTYEALGISMFTGGAESLLNTYKTEYLIWANDAAKEKLGRDFTGEGPMISPCFLMNVLFEQCGWDGPSYQKLTDEVMAATPIVSELGWYSKDGELVSRDDLSEAAQQCIVQLRHAQYYLARESGGVLPANNK